MENHSFEAAPSESSIANTRRFVSAQRRYDNLRVRDSEISKRLCYDCGEIVCGGEREYQEHILVHEAVYLAYQLYHFENGQGGQLPSGQNNKRPDFHQNVQQDKLTKDNCFPSRSEHEVDEELGVPLSQEGSTNPAASLQTTNISYENRFIPESSNQLLTTVAPIVTFKSNVEKIKTPTTFFSSAAPKVSSAEELTMETERAVSSIEDWMI